MHHTGHKLSQANSWLCWVCGTLSLLHPCPGCCPASLQPQHHLRIAKQQHSSLGAASVGQLPFLTEICKWMLWDCCSLCSVPTTHGCILCVTGVLLWGGKKLIYLDMLLFYASLPYLFPFLLKMPIWNTIILTQKMYLNYRHNHSWPFLPFFKTQSYVKTTSEHFNNVQKYTFKMYSWEAIRRQCRKKSKDLIYNK